MISLKHFSAAALLIFLPSCTVDIHVGKAPKLRHVVVAWLKDHGNAAQRTQLLEAGDKLRTIPGVQQVVMGQCLPSPRPVVDSTFDVAYVMTFADAEHLQQYLVHPTHVQLVKDVLKPLTKRLQVYDLIEP